MNKDLPRKKHFFVDPAGKVVRLISSRRGHVLCFPPFRS
jgi:hypothetical protein